MGESACKCVHFASSNLPYGPVSLQAKLRGGGDFWSWIGVHFITQPCEHNNRNL